MQGSAAVVGPRKVPSRALALGTALSVLSACGVQIDDASDAAPGAAFDTAAWSSGGDAAIPGVVANGGASAATLSAFASAYAHAVCDHIGPCCQANGVAYAPGGCLVAREDQAETMLASVHGSTFSPAAAAACIAFMETAAKQCNDNELPYADPCGQLFVGTKQPGEPCTVATDCVAPPAGSSMQCAGVSQGDGIQLFCQVQAPPSKLPLQPAPARADHHQLQLERRSPHLLSRQRVPATGRGRAAVRAGHRLRRDRLVRQRRLHGRDRDGRPLRAPGRCSMRPELVLRAVVGYVRRLEGGRPVLQPPAAPARVLGHMHQRDVRVERAREPRRLRRLSAGRSGARGLTLRGNPNRFPAGARARGASSRSVQKAVRSVPP